MKCTKFYLKVSLKYFNEIFTRQNFMDSIQNFMDSIQNFMDSIQNFMDSIQNFKDSIQNFMDSIQNFMDSILTTILQNGFCNNCNVGAFWYLCIFWYFDLTIYRPTCFVMGCSVSTLSVLLLK